MNSNKLFFTILLLVSCLGQIASDIYAPSLPAIAHELHSPISHVQWSMAIYMLGMSLSQLIYGPLSDGLGRRIPLLTGLLIVLFGSIVCLFAPNIKILIAGRLIEGCGAGASATLWRSIFRDKYQGEQLAKYGSFLAIFYTFIIPASPTLGGYLQEYFGWRSNFVFLILYTLITLLLVLISFQETSQHHHHSRLNTQFITQSFKEIFTHRQFVAYTLCSFFSYGAFFCWFNTGPVLLIHIIGVSPVAFGWITFLGGGSAIALSSYINGKIVSRFGMQNLLQVGLLIMFAAGSIMLLGKLIFGITLLAITVPMVVFYFGVTFIWPNAFSSAITPFGKIAGYAGAAYGFTQIAGAFVIGTIASYLPTSNQIPLALIFMTAPLLSWLILKMFILDRPI